jgi:signal peptidase I
MPVIMDFSLGLVALAALTGVIWSVDHWLLRPRRAADAREPVAVEYARSFFPIILIVLAVRSFLFEPFRIPSDSMMPTLLDGDFIFVSKFAYGLRLPVLNRKILETGVPVRGDVIVFRKPSEPSVNYIKRLVGLPGDRIEVRGDAVWVNGEEMKARDDGLYTEDECYRDFHQGVEELGTLAHRIMYCPAVPRTVSPKDSHGNPRLEGSSCSAKREFHACDAAPTHAAPSDDEQWQPRVGEVCEEPPAGVHDVRRACFYEVPPGNYFFMGDDRDNSADSRYGLGFVPEGNLVGKAVRIWLNISLPPAAAWHRIGVAIR